MFPYIQHSMNVGKKEYHQVAMSYLLHTIFLLKHKGDRPEVIASFIAFATSASQEPQGHGHLHTRQQ